MALLTRMVNPSEKNRGLVECLLGHLTDKSSSLSPNTFEAMLANEHYHLLILEASRGYRGMGSVFFQRNLCGWLGEVHDVVVNPKYRGRGFGTAIMEGILGTAQDFANQNGDFVLSLTSRPRRQAANRLYQRLGFTLVAQAEGERGTNLYKLPICSDAGDEKIRS